MYTVFTDGSCNYNKRGVSNIGSYAFVILNESGVKIYENCEKVENTTNNRMEMCGIINALKKLKESSEEIVIHTDSEYISKAINEGWLKKWKTRNFKKGKDQHDIPNKDLWVELESLLKPNIRVKWVKSHSGNVWNEYCDKLCNSVYTKNFRVLN